MTTDKHCRFISAGRSVLFLWLISTWRHGMIKWSENKTG